MFTSELRVSYNELKVINRAAHQGGWIMTASIADVYKLTRVKNENIMDWKREWDKLSDEDQNELKELASKSG